MNCIAGCIVKDFSFGLQHYRLSEQQKWHPATGVENAGSPVISEQAAIAICYSSKYKAVQQVDFLGLEILAV